MGNFIRPHFFAIAAILLALGVGGSLAFGFSIDMIEKDSSGEPIRGALARHLELSEERDGTNGIVFGEVLDSGCDPLGCASSYSSIWLKLLSQTEDACRTVHYVAANEELGYRLTARDRSRSPCPKPAGGFWEITLHLPDGRACFFGEKPPET